MLGSRCAGKEPYKNYFFPKKENFLFTFYIAFILCQALHFPCINSCSRFHNPMR